MNTLTNLFTNMIDTHCHIDLYENPQAVVEESERLNIITIAVTLLPSHFEEGYPFISHCKKVRLALGMHPLKSEFHETEFSKFTDNIESTSYIGEVGLDFSQEGISTKNTQLYTFDKILNLIKNKKKIISLHSRKAEKEVLDLLIKYKIPNAIFHWYTGPLKLIDEIVSRGYFFSINTAMIKSKNGQNIISKIPLEKILTESDGPYIQLNEKPVKPSDLKSVIEYLSLQRKIAYSECENIILNNFFKLINKIKS